MKIAKILIILVLLVIAFVFVLFTLQQNRVLSISFDHSKAAIVTDLEGDVKVVTSGGSKTIVAFKNMRFTQGDKLLTGDGAWVSLKIDTDKEIMVSENTSLGLEELNGSNDSVITLLALETGKVWTNIKEKLNGNSKYEIKTPTATMGVRGTQFYINVAKDATQVAVLDGTVSTSTKIMSKDSKGEEEVTLLIQKNKQILINKEQVATKEELEKKVQALDLSSLDDKILKFIQKNPDGIDQNTLKEINEFFGAKDLETTMIQEDKVLLKGTVILPNDQRNTGGGHIHIRNSKNDWVYYGLLNANGDFVAGNLPDGSYWLRSDPTQVNEYARSNEVPFTITNGKANPDKINVHLNDIQLSGTILNPGGTPVTEGYLYISDSQNNWIYYAEVERAINTINIGGLRDGSYTMIAYPSANSEFVPANARSFTIKNGKSDSRSITLMLNTSLFSGTVLLANGNKASAGGHVHVRDEKGNWSQYATLDANGGFKIGGLAGGKYWLRADTTDDSVSSKELELNIINGKAIPAAAQLILNK